MRLAAPAMALLILTSALTLGSEASYAAPQGLAPPSDSSGTSPLSPPVNNPSSPPFSTNVKLSDDTGTGNQNEVSMTMDTEGRIVAAWNDRRGGNDYRCGRTYSLDGGTTWSANVLYRNSTYDAAGDPVVTADDDGNIYLICMSFDRSGSPRRSTMEVMRTSDGGVTWTAPVDIGLSGGLNDKPWIAAHGSGIVYAGWTLYSGSPNIVFRVSTDYGQTWTSPQNLGVGSSQYLGMDVDDSGAVHVAFRQGSYMVYRRSEDQGASFTPAVQISPGGTSCFGCTPRSGTLPTLAVSGTGDDIYVVWSAFMGNSTGEDITLAFSHDRGATWQAVKVNDDTTDKRQFMPFVDVDWEGRVHVIWSDLRSGDHEIFYANSTDGGSTFTTNLAVTDQSAATIGFQGDYQALFVDRMGIAHIAWCDTRNGNGDIYHATALVADRTVATIAVTPSFSQITADETQQFTAAGYDALGSPIAISPTWETTGGFVDASGLYAPSPTGNFTIYANESGVSGSAIVEVTPGALASIVVDPAFVVLPVDQIQQFTAAGYDAKGNPVSISPAWETTGGFVDFTGLYTPLQVGNFTLYANDSGVSGFAVVEVVPGVLASIVVDPSFAVITVDDTQQFTATGYDSFGNPVPLSPTWETTGGSIDSSGLYTPTSLGGFLVFANQSGLSGSAAISVNPGALASIVVDPPFSIITADETQQFTATGYDSMGNAVPVSPAWTATSGTIGPTGLFEPWAVGNVTVFANDSGVSGIAYVEVLAGALASIVVDPPTATITADETQQFTAAGYDAKGNVVPISPAWSAGNGTIDGGGLFTPWSVGSWLVTATQGLVDGTATVVVTQGSLVSIVVDPPTATVTADDTQQFTAAGYDARGNAVPISPVWETSGGAIDSAGLYTPSQVGTYMVYANQSGVSGSATVTVVAGALTAIDVDPPFAAITADQAQQFTATGYDAKGNQVSISPVWATTNGSITGGGLFSPWAVGNVTVFANDSGVSGIAYVEVLAGALASIVVDPPTATITADETQQFTAAGYDAKGNAVPIIPIWQTTGGSVSTSGLYTPFQVGSFTIYANSSGVSGSAAIEVAAGALASIVVDPPTAAITADDTQQFTAMGYDAKGNAVPISPVWETTGGSIDAAGLYTPSQVGAYLVYANQSGVSGSATVTVVAGALASIVVDPPTAAITADDTQQFTAAGYDANGNAVPISPVWETTGGSVDAAGLYTPSPAGSFIVYANQSGVSGSAVVDVSAGALTIILVSPETSSITADQTQQFTATGYDAHGNPVPVFVTWTVNNGSISGSGFFIPWAVGTWIVIAEQDGVMGTAAVTVTAGAIVRLDVSPAYVTLPVGYSVDFTAIGWDAKGNPVADPDVTWSLDGGVGNLLQSGRFESTRGGTGFVIASVDGMSASGRVEVQVDETPTVSVNPWPYTLIILAVVLILLLVLLGWRRRRKEEPQRIPPGPPPK